MTRGRAKHGDDGAGNLGVADVGSLLVQERGDGRVADELQGELVAAVARRSVTTSSYTSDARRVWHLILSFSSGDGRLEAGHPAEGAEAPAGEVRSRGRL